MALVDPLAALDGGDGNERPRAIPQARWPAVALVASLVLNGFLIGMFVADSLKPHRRGFSGERFARFELRRFDDRLPPGRSIRSPRG